MLCGSGECRSHNRAAFTAHGYWDDRIETSSWSALTLGVSEYMTTSKIHLLNEGKTIIELLFRFTRETDDDIRCDRNIWDRFPGCRDKFRVIILLCFPCHAAKCGIRS